MQRQREPQTDEEYRDAYEDLRAEALLESEYIIWRTINGYEPDFEADVRISRLEQIIAEAFPAIVLPILYDYGPHSFPEISCANNPGSRD